MKVCRVLPVIRMQMLTHSGR